MIDSGDLSGLDLPDVDANSDLGGIGAVELNHTNQDIDGDGVLDSDIFHSDDGMEVWSDMDHDGYAEHLSVVESDGDYAAWEFHHYPDGRTEWVQVDKGTMGK